MFYRYVRKFESLEEQTQYFVNKNINTKSLSIRELYLLVLDAYQKYNLEILAQYGAFDMIVYLSQTHQFQKADITLALRLAALNGFYEIVQVLFDINFKLEIKLTVRDYSIALNYATQTNHEDIIQMILNQNESLTEQLQTSDYSNALQSAARTGHMHLVIKFLSMLRYGSLKLDDYVKIINNATSYGSIDIITLVLSHATASRIRISANDCHTARCIAAHCHHYGIFKYLESL
jgi:hypothetical protein